MSKTKTAIAKPLTSGPGSFLPGQQVRVTGNHPWAGETGQTIAYEPYGPAFLDWRGWKLILDNGSECYADANQLKRQEIVS